MAFTDERPLMIDMDELIISLAVLSSTNHLRKRMKMKKLENRMFLIIKFLPQRYYFSVGSTTARSIAVLGISA